MAATFSATLLGVVPIPRILAELAVGRVEAALCEPCRGELH